MVLGIGGWPAKSTFQPPRYPNAWFLVSAELAADYQAAVRFIDTALCSYVGFADTLRPGTLAECSDAQRRVHHILPVTGLGDAWLDHFHDLHIRYYFSHLYRLGRHQVRAGRGRAAAWYWRLAASVHFEPEAEHPGHPYIDSCPVCGVFPPFDLPGDRCEKCHDPLGLELLFFGTVRSQPVCRSDGSAVGGLQQMAGRYGVDLRVEAPFRPAMNTLRIGTATISAAGAPAAAHPGHPDQEVCD